MKKEINKDLKKYLSVYSLGWQIATICVCAMTVMSSVFAFIINPAAGRDVDYTFFIFYAIGIAVCLVPLFSSMIFFKKLTNNAEFEKIEEDFGKAVPKRKDSIRLGEKWVFIKSRGKILPYSEIKQVYQYIHKTNFAEDKRALKYVDLKGRHHILCGLELNDKSNPEMMDIMRVLISHNPTIKIGYK